MIFPFIVINTQSSVFTTTPHSQQIILASSRTQSVEAAHTASDVPFYSQFVDISAPAWKKVGCGIASLAMIIDFYKPASPLETFQIERIAMCRAKLARLYEVESVRLQLAQQELINDSKKIINAINSKPIVKTAVRDGNTTKDSLDVINIPLIQLGNLNFENQIAMVSDLEHHPFLKCYGIDGLIGSNLFTKTVLANKEYDVLTATSKKLLSIEGLK